MSNAERQRRYRAKHKTVTKRNGGSPPDVTPELFNDATDNEAENEATGPYSPQQDREQFSARTIA